MEGFLNFLKIIGIILVVALVAALGYWLYGAFKPAESEFELVDGTTDVDPNSVMTISSNGGYDGSYIDEHEADPNCPTADDKFFTIGMDDYKDEAVFYFTKQINNTNFVVNAIFDKTDSGLVFTGCFNVKVSVSGILFWKTFTFQNLMNAGNNFSPLPYELGPWNGINWWPGIGVQGPHYFAVSHKPTYEALREGTITVPTAGIQALGNLLSTSIDGNAAYQVAEAGCYKIFNDYFEQLGSIGVKIYDNSNHTIFGDMNTFYNAVYKSAQIAGADCSVNVTNLTGDVVNGIVYKSNRFLNVTYKNFLTKNCFKFGQMSLPQQANGGTDDTIATPPVNLNVTFKLVNTTGADITGIDLTANKVQFKLVNTATTNEYFVTFDELSDFSGQIKSMPAGAYTYTISSNILNFGGNTGTLTVDKTHQKFNFNFTYQGNFVNATVTLQPIANVDLSAFDITQTPVAIHMQQTDGTYFDFVFNTVSEFENGITKSIKIGAYTWSISSDELTFSNLSGTLTVTTLTNQLTYYYDYIHIQDFKVVNDLNFNATNLSYGYTNIHVGQIPQSLIDDLKPQGFNAYKIAFIVINLTQNTTQTLESNGLMTYSSNYEFNTFTVSELNDQYAIQVRLCYQSSNEQTLKYFYSNITPVTLYQNGLKTGFSFSIQANS